MKTLFYGLLITAFISLTATAEETLVLDFESDDGSIMYLAHHIPVFPFESTTSYIYGGDENLSDRMKSDALLNHLVVTGLIKIDGEVVGMATEQEYIDFEAGNAKSAWLFILNHPKWKGTFAVEQVEGDQGIGAVRQQVMADPYKNWPDRYQRFRQTIGDAQISMASEGLEVFKGARFVEYNFINPADWNKLGRFRAKLQFEIMLE